MKFSHVSAYSFGKSFKGKLEKTDRLYTPGPGQYSPGMTKRSAPSWRLGTEPRSRGARNDTPGPGQYTLSSSIGRAPKYTISSKSGYVDMNKFIVSPGPGMYTPNYNKMFRSFSYSMRLRPSSSKPDYTPGPGNYNIRTEKSLQVPCIKFGFEKRDGLQSDNRHVPGPGNYNSKTTIGKDTPQFSFGKELRADRGRPMTPGPGHYQHKVVVGREGPKITMSSRPKTSLGESRFIPGPGQYNISIVNRPKSPSYKIGTAPRGIAFNSEMPGPGQYSPNCENVSTRPKSPNWSMGKSTRTPLNPYENVPGPGNYQIKSKVGEGPKYTIVGRNINDANGSAFVPGPGQYNSATQSNLFKSPAWKIGTGSRDDLLKRTIRENIPGPGNYTVRSKHEGPSFRFGTESRGQKLKDDIPGPGQYHIPCSMVDVASFQRQTGGFDGTYRYI